VSCTLLTFAILMATNCARFIACRVPDQFAMRSNRPRACFGHKNGPGPLVLVSVAGAARHR
jgi:hypothetical protein